VPAVSRFVSDSITTLLVAIFNRGIGIGAGIVLARYLGPVGKGYVAYAPIVMELFVTAMNGVAQAVTYQYGRNGLPGAAVHRAMTRIVIAASIPLSIAIAVVAWLVPSQHVLIAAAVALPFALYTTAAMGMLIGADRISATNVQRAIISSGFNAVTVAVVVLLHADYRVVLGAWAVSYIAAAIYSYVAMRPFIKGDERATPAMVREQLSFGSTSGLAQLAGFINMRIDVIVVSFALGVKAVGLYTLAVNLAELLWQVSAPMATAAFPRIATGDEGASARFTAKLIRHILALMVPIGVVCFFAGPPLITLLYGHAFEASGGALRFIVPGVVAYAVEGPLGYYLLVRMARPWLIVAIQSASVVVCAGLTFATVHTYGIEGAAAATSITYVAVVVIKGSIFLRATGMKLRDLVMISSDDVRDVASIGQKIVRRFVPARAA
jgi:O-antigen/teichoic acid export membrane protein